MRHGPLTAIAWRLSRSPFNGCTPQPGMFRSESTAAAWSASIALLQRLCRPDCTFRLLPVSKTSRSPACRKLTITVPSVTKHATGCQPLLYMSRKPARRGRPKERPEGMVDWFETARLVVDIAPTPRTLERDAGSLEYWRGVTCPITCSRRAIGCVVLAQTLRLLRAMCFPQCLVPFVSPSRTTSARHRQREDGPWALDVPSDPRKASRRVSAS